MLLFANACTNSCSYRSPAKKHARRVALRLGLSRGLIYLVAKPTTLLDDSDQSVPFRQRRYFYYLSGVDEPDCYLTYDLKRDHLILYVPDFDLRHAVWMGHTLTVEEAMKKYLEYTTFFTHAISLLRHLKGMMWMRLDIIIHSDTMLRNGFRKKEETLSFIFSTNPSGRGYPCRD